MEQDGSHSDDFDNLKDTELRLGLPGTSKEVESQIETAPKRSSAEAGLVDSLQDIEPASKAQVVGWPPVRSYRKNSIQAMKMDGKTTGMYVKVSMDGAPYLRKIDLKVYKGYKELRVALECMFKCFSPVGGNSTLDGHYSSDYAITYEDKDGDLLLVGDVPWEMFVSSCKKLRILNGSEPGYPIQTRENQRNEAKSTCCLACPH